MHQFRKWPLASAVTAAVLLTGCLSGGGGSHGGGGSSPTPPGTDNPTDPTPTTTRYELTVEAPSAEQVAAYARPTGHTERLLAAVLDALISPAFAQAVGALSPSDFRLVVINGDNRGTPGDASDDEDIVLKGGEDFAVAQSGGTYLLDLPYEPQIGAYIGADIGDGKELSVSIYKQQSLVASPVSTFITRAIVNRADELNELSVEEFDKLVEEITAFAQDPATQQAINEAYRLGTDTEDMLEQIAAQLSLVVSDALDRGTAPAATEDTLASVNGEYHFQSFNIGVYSSANGGGALVGGNDTDVQLSADAADQVTFSSAAGDSLEYEAVSDLSGYRAVHAAISDEADQDTMAIDSRGLTVASSEDITPYNKNDNAIVTCQASDAACVDREFESTNRLLAAGTGSPYATLVGHAYDDRLVTDANGERQLQVLGGFLDIAVKKPVGIPSLGGEYGIIEVQTETRDDNAPEIDYAVRMIDLTLGEGSTASLCERRYRNLFINLETLTSRYPRTPYNLDCSSSNPLFSTTTYSVGESGRVELTSVDPTEKAVQGWVSEDGLTLLASSQQPGRSDIEEVGGTELRDEPTGKRTGWIGVKRDRELSSLANRKYKIMSVGLGSIYNANEVGGYRTVEVNRLVAGTLEFNAQGGAVLTSISQSQAARQGELGRSFRDLQTTFTFTAQNVNLADGRLSMLSVNTEVVPAST